VKELKAFAKVRLGPGESTAVGFELGERSFAYYDVADEDWPALLERHPVSWAPREVHLHRREAGWYVDPGSYQVHVGRSSAQIAHTVTIEVIGSPDPLDPSGPLD
jgi:mannose-6-phosphate isomerase-like protein (cupin superfamily)